MIESWICCLFYSQNYAICAGTHASIALRTSSEGPPRAIYFHLESMDESEHRLRFAMICASNMNRSMEAHFQLLKVRALALLVQCICDGIIRQMPQH